MIKLSDLTFDDIANARVELYENNPVISHFGGSFTAADPSLLTPDVAHDNRWHLFCHTFFGVYHFASFDGVRFFKEGKVVSRAMRPNINRIGDRYYLFFERTRTLLGNALTLLGAKWRSAIYYSQSVDLRAWTVPRPVIEHSRDFETNDLGTSISNPFLIEKDGRYRLYYSCGLTFIEECGFSEPTYITYAESNKICEDYETIPKPIISPDPQSKYLNLCSGCIKVYKLKDCYIGLQNGIYKSDGKSHSAIMLLRSDDGVKFQFVKPLIEPTEGWMAQYVYACALTCYTDELRIYFNARNVAHPLKGREDIGFARLILQAPDEREATENDADSEE